MQVMPPHVFVCFLFTLDKLEVKIYEMFFDHVYLFFICFTLGTYFKIFSYFIDFSLLYFLEDIKYNIDIVIGFILIYCYI